MAGIDTTEAAHRVRQRDPADFEEGSLRTIDLAEGVQAVVGRLKGPAARKVAKSEARRVIYYVLYEPEVDDAHGERMSADEIAEMAWRSFGCRRVRVEHGYQQGLRNVLGVDELPEGDGVVVEHYILPAEVEPGGMFHGAVLAAGIKAGACIEAIRYSPDLYAVLSRVEHGISLGGKANKEER